jgi:hypothetical protein
MKIALRERHPLQEVFEEPFADEHWSRLAAYSFFQQYQPPDQREIEKYQRAYETWLTATVDFFQTLPERLSARSAVAEVIFRLANTGTEVAKSLLVEFWATPGFLIRPPPDEDRSGTQDRETRLPQAPEPPRGRYVDRFASMAAAMGLPGAAPPSAHAAVTASFIPNHDLDAFYYRDRPRHFVDSVSLDCSLFRHQLAPEPFAFEVQWQGDKQRTRGAIHCRVSAEKSELAEFVLPVNVSIQQGDMSGEIERFRPKPPFGRKRSKPADTGGA